jgi:hypothetical protein
VFLPLVGGQVLPADGAHPVGRPGGAAQMANANIGSAKNMIPNREITASNEDSRTDGPGRLHA